MKLKTADETGEIMLQMLLANLVVSSGEELLVIINGGGCDDADGVMASLSWRSSTLGRKRAQAGAMKKAR